MKALVFLICFLIVVCRNDAIDDCSGIKDWTHSQILDCSENIQLHWKVNNESISMMVIAKTTGWVGVGFSPSGSMKGADIVMGWVKDGKVHLQDRHAPKNTRPVIDEQQDYELLGGSETNSTTTLCFKRKLNTCDKDDFVITSDTIRMIWAFNDEDPENEKYEAPSFHKMNRGVKSLYLITGSLEKPSLNNVTTLDIRMPNVSVPNGLDTVYWCHVFRLPKLETKHHMIGYKPYIKEGHEDLIHHLLVYECHGSNVTQELDPHLNEKGYHCYTPEMPKAYLLCRQVIVTWAVGSEGIFLPSVAGYPLGDRNGGYTYLMFEMHYNNPTLKKDLVDSSGITIYYTKELRKHDASVLVTGHAVGPYQIIPPRLESFLNTGHCSHTCTEAKLPKEGVNAFGILLHSHLLGKSIKVRHFRGSKELPPIADNKYYDFNYQQEQLFQKELKIFPNDSITTECIYDSSGRTVTTFGGESTKEEMCLSFIMYYPKVDLSGCESSPTFDDLLDIIGLNGTGLSSYNKTLLYYQNIYNQTNRNWTKEEIQKAQLILSSNDKYAFCISGDGQEILNKDSPEYLVNYPAVDLYVPPEDKTCPSENSASKLNQWHLSILLIIGSIFIFK